MQESSAALDLVKNGREAVLATLESEAPFTSAISYFWMPEVAYGKMILLMSHLARHTKNILQNSKVSLLVLESGSQYIYERKRVSVQGEIKKVSSGQDIYKKKYLEIFPESEMLFQLPDFNFYEVLIQELYYVGGFGKIQSFR